MDEQARRLVLFDFDGTLFRLATDWSRVRAELERIAREQDLQVDGGGILDLALTADGNRLVTQAELDGLARGAELSAGVELYRRLAAEGAELAVVTHNGGDVVRTFFSRHDVPPPTRIFDRNALGTLKWKSDALADYARDAASVVVVGDSEHDRRLAERLRAPFVDPLQDYYDREAAAVDELAATYRSPIPYRRWFYGRRFAVVLAALDPQPGDEVLELGCGGGHYTSALVELGARVTATDLSPAYVEQARRFAPEARFAVEDAQRLSFPDGSFDRVLATEVVEHVRDPEAVVREAHRVLRAGGVLALSTPSRRSPLNLAYGLKRRARDYSFNEHLHELTPRELRRLLHPWFEIERFERANALLPYPLDSLYVRLGSPALPLLDRIERVLAPLGWTMVVRARRR